MICETSCIINYQNQVAHLYSSINKEKYYLSFFCSLSQINEWAGPLLAQECFLKPNGFDCYIISILICNKRNYGPSCMCNLCSNLLIF